MAPAASVDIAGGQVPRNGSRKSGRKDASRFEPPKQTPSGPPTPDITDGLEEFDRFFLRLHEQRDEFESNLFSGLNAHKSLEQRYAELRDEHKKKEDELSSACAEIEKLGERLAMKDQEAATRDAELEKSKQLIKKHGTEKKDLGNKVSEQEWQLKQKDELTEQANEKARKAVEEKDEALRAAEKRIQKILVYAQTKVSEVVDKNQELLKRLHGALIVQRAPLAQNPLTAVRPSPPSPMTVRDRSAAETI